MFVATPPLEAKKILFSLWSSQEGLCLEFIDVARAYFHAGARRLTYVDLPEEDSEEGTRGLLRKAMYGTCDAAQNGKMEHAEILEAGFRQGASSACTFYHEQKNDSRTRVATSQR